MTEEQEEETSISPEELIALCEFLDEDVEKMRDKELLRPSDGIPVQFGDGMVEVFRAGYEGLSETKKRLTAEGINPDALVASIRHRFQYKSEVVPFPRHARKRRGPVPT